MKKRLSIVLMLVILFNLFPKGIFSSLMPDIAMAASISFITLENIRNEVYVKRGGALRNMRASVGEESLMFNLLPY